MRSGRGRLRMAVLMGITVLYMGSASLGSMRATAQNSPGSGNTQNFFAAAALQQADFPRGLIAASQGALTADHVVAIAGPDTAAALAGAGFNAGFEQAYRATGLAALLGGDPAAAADLILTFDTANGASSWYTTELQDVQTLGQQLAAGQGVTFDVSAVVPVSLSLAADQASAFDVQGTATASGLAIPLDIDVALMQRGRVQYAAFVIGTMDQAAALQMLAQTLDASVAAALPLLGDGQ